MSVIEEIKDRLDIVDIVSETVQLRRSGKNYTGFCPFHSNTRTPSFVVFPETGTWRCFGQCAEGGDIFKFVMKREGSDFAEALRVLAERAGVQLKPVSPQEEERKEEHQRLRTLLDEAVAFYRHHMLNNPAGKVALDYLHKRGLTDETIELFELGYAPAGYENTIKHFTEKGYDKQDLIDTGLVTVKDDGGIYDRFRHRLMIPIRDARGRMAGFGARVLNPDDVPKYLNSPQTPLFDKSNLLYGLDKARRSIRSEDQVVIVEGYLDVIAPYQAGFTNLVSPMGTALNERQLRQLKRYTRRIVLALDADTAGEKATLRGLQVARQTLDREADFSFDARGLLHQEGRLQADIRVTTLPEGLDPDEVVNQDSEAWPQLIEAAKPIVIHVMETLAADKDLEDPKDKREVAAQVMPLIQDIPSAIERDTYVQQLARMLKVDESALVAEYSPRRRARRSTGRRPTPHVEEVPPEEAAEPRIGDDPVHKLEAYCLGMLIRQPELIYRLDRQLQQAGLPRLSEDDFKLTSHQELFHLINESLHQDYVEPLNFALVNLPMPLMDFTESILERTEELNLQEERVLEELIRSILNLRKRNLQAYNNQLRFLQEEAQEQGDDELREYLKKTAINIETLKRLDAALGKTL